MNTGATRTDDDPLEHSPGGGGSTEQRAAPVAQDDTADPLEPATAVQGDEGQTWESNETSRQVRPEAADRTASKRIGAANARPLER